MVHKTVKKYMLENSGKEAHMVGDCVGVCWNIKRVEKKLQKDGLAYKATVWEREDNEPYIDFVSIREYEKDDFVEDEDSPAVGGMSPKGAANLIDELNAALKYIKSL